MDNNDQRHLSEQLLLLHELQHPDLDIPYQGAPTHRNIQSPDTSRELRLLDTITVAGNPGDVFCSCVRQTGANAACPSEKRVSHTGRRGCRKRTHLNSSLYVSHLSPRESCCHTCIGHLSLPDGPVWGQHQ